MSNVKAIAHVSRRDVWQALEEIKTWSAKLETTLQKDPEGVIPWIQLEGITEAAAQLVYSAGHVNAIKLAGLTPEPEPKPTEVKPRMRVKVVRLQSTEGFMIKEHHLDCRKVGVTGTVTGYVPGHGGDVWWVRHDGSETVGAYSTLEFEPLVEENNDRSNIPDSPGTSAAILGHADEAAAKT